MAGAKIVVMYPYPKDVDAFERAYTEEHAPMVTSQAFPGIRKFVATRVLGTPDGSQAAIYRVAELYFASMADLQSAAASASAQPVVAHAVSISSGGAPIVLVAQEDTTTF